MVLRLFIACLLVGLLLAGPIPLATFHGKVKGVSNKQITIENEEGNLVDFEINRKTRLTREKKPITASDLQTGDIVTIEAKQEMVRFLVAVTITAQPRE